MLHPIPDSNAQLSDSYDSSFEEEEWFDDPSGQKENDFFGDFPPVNDSFLVFSKAFLYDSELKSDKKF